MFSKDHALNLLFRHMLDIEGSLRDSIFRKNARFKAMALEIKSDPALFQKQSLREA